MLRLARPSTGALMVCAGIANTGYLGVPLARSLFDESQAVGQAITYDVVVSATFLLLVGFAIGAGFGTTRRRHAARARCARSSCATRRCSPSCSRSSRRRR